MCYIYVINIYIFDIYSLHFFILSKRYYNSNDFLAHPNVKVFISHGGALSTQESMSHGVPVVGLPVFLDQIQNIQKLVIRGLGQQLSYKDLSEETVCAALNEIIDNKR